MKSIKKDKAAIQTLFRTTSKNHYTLIEAIDRKASIILTINSILISVVLGSIYLVDGSQKSAVGLIAQVTIYSGFLSMIFALLSILPHRYKKNDSIIYAGASSVKTRDDFQSKFNTLLQSSETIYTAMINDIYDIGISIRRRQFLVRCSVAVIIIGILSNVILSIVIL